MLRGVFRVVFAMVVMLGVLSVSERALAQVPARKTLPSRVPAEALGGPTGRFAETNRMHLAIGLPLRNQTELGEFLRELYDPGSTNFHKYLTTPEFTERFGPTEEDYQAVRRFAETNGLQVTHTLGSRLLLDVEGGVPDVERAFQITLRTYRHPTEARDFVAPDRAPSVPFDLAVADIGGLSDFSRPHPLVRLSRALSKPLAGTAPSGYYGGNDFRKAYVPGLTLDGSGQTVGLLELDGYNARDITNYESAVGVTNHVGLTNVLLDGFSGRAGANNIEVALDIEMVMCVATNASRIIVYEENPSSLFFNPEDVVHQMANDNLAKQMSSSWTWSGGPDTNIENAFLQMQAQGQSFFQAAGDSDAYTGSQQLDNPAQANSPAGSSNITVVGGTTLTMNGSGASWSSETVWNWNSLGGSDANVGSSGGVSTSNAIPWWQTNVNMSFNNGSTTHRNIPDVALTADNVFVVYTSGHNSVEGGVGGTSCAAPLWAAFTALVNQQATLSGKGPVGFANPAIYRIGLGPNYTNCFHDITVSNNIGSGTPGLYVATNGYDLCTGWGTPNGTNLINALAALPPYIIQPPASLTASNGQVVALSVIPGGEPPFGYHWQLDGTNLAANGTVSGTGSNILTFTSITTNYSGNYTVIVTNLSGSVTSSVAAVTVVVGATNQPPTLAPIANQTIYALSTLRFTNSASDSDGDSLTFSLDPGAPTNATINAATGVFSWTPTQLQAPATNTITVRVTDNGVPPLSAAQTFTVTVLQTNLPPVLAPIANQTIYALSTLVINPVASDPNNPPKPLTFSLDPGAPANATISAATGVFSWTPTQPQAPSTNTITVRVTDNAVPALSAAQSFTVTVLQTNLPPILAPITNEMIYATTTLTITNVASDPNNPPRPLTFSLGAGAPTNAVIDATNGVFTWTPTQPQAPSTNLITVRVTDNAVPALSAAQSFTVTVLQTNFPPVLAPIANQTIYALSTLVINAVASDPNDPPKPLTFSLDPGAPTNAVINSTNGVFTWTPTQPQAPSTSVITVRVTDNAVPPLSATQSFTVTVLQTNLPPVLAPITNETVFATTTLTITNIASDPNNPPEALTFSLDPGAPTNAVINPTNGVFTWTPTQQQAPSTNVITVRVTDDVVPPLSAAQSFTVTVLQTNLPPVLAPITDETIYALSTLVINAVASDPNDPPEALTFSLDPGAPTNAAINPTNGVFSWTPTQLQAPSTSLITVRVTDDAVPPLSMAQSFTVTVLQTNLPPVLEPITNETIFATTTLNITNVASDPNNPPDTLTFSLDAGAPTNAIIDPTNGVFTWTPTQPQAPSTNLITVRVTDDAVPPLSVAQSFTVTVLPTNFPPVVAPIADEIVHVGMTVVVTNSASDPNDPTNSLLFSLDPGAPASATIDPGSGLFMWTPGGAYANTTNEITVRVTDDAVPPLSVAQSFSVAVLPLAFQPVTLSNGVLTISWGAISGLTYRVQYTTNLSETNWTDLPPDVMATSNVASTTDFTQPDAQRFYRIVVLP